jgi:hypothetical protein
MIPWCLCYLAIVYPISGLANFYFVEGKTEHFKVLRAAHIFMAFKVRGNVIYIYCIINKPLLRDSSILLYTHKVVISYCLSANYIYCLTVQISEQKDRM